MRTTPSTCLLLALLAACTAAPRADLVVADFEAASFGAWTVTGTAFGPGPARGTLPDQMVVGGFAGEGLVDTFHGGDASTGTLTSAPFPLERRYLRFLIGGGKDPERLALQLLVDGVVVRAATGGNDRPGGSEALAPTSWDVAEFAGRTAVLRIVDAATGGWGHLNVDQIVLTDRRPPQLVRGARRDFAVAQRYLRVPIQNGAPRRKVTLLVDGRTEVTNDIELADGDPDWWAVLDVQRWRGRTVTVQVDELWDDSRALAAITASDTVADDLYREALRGQLHFSSARGWNNDPNGLCWFGGEYHLFYQHNPYGWGWGNMHWGHATSTDLVHWREQGDALAPDALGAIYSGSAVVDRDNTSGLGAPGESPLVLVYTAAGERFTQCLAASRDGRTFTKFAGNPVLGEVTHENRDPRVFWHEATQRWVMVLYVEERSVHTVHVYTSPNLRDWTLGSKTPSTHGGSWLYECPDLFPLAIDGDPQRIRWVLTAANADYAIGTFDGVRFTAEQENLRGQFGRGCYAAQTFGDLPASDGRRIQIGWWQTETRGMPCNQSMTLPCELSLLTTPDGPRLARQPVRELMALRARSHRCGPRALGEGEPDPLAGQTAELAELCAEFAPGTARSVTFTIRGLAIRYDVAREELVVGDLRAPAPLRSGRQRLVVFVDRTGLEVFASDGLCYVPLPWQPNAADRAVGVAVAGGVAQFTTLDLHELRSAWTR